MTSSRVQFHRRLLAGYGTLLRGAFRLVAATVFLLVVSAAVSLPVWFFAHTSPLAFDILVLSAIGAAIVWSLVRRVRSGGNGWSLRHVVISAALIAGPIFVLVLALVSQSAVLAIAGALFLSGIVAWRVVPS